MDHHFNIEIAEKYGVGEAILLHNICFWQKKNIANNVNYHDGRYWVYNSVQAYSELFPYYTDRQIRTILKKLEDKGCLHVGRYNKMKIDRTKWYSVNDEIMLIHGIKPNDTKSQMQLRKNVNAMTQNVKCNDTKSQMQVTKMSNGCAQNVKPIPYINTDKRKDNNTDTYVRKYPSFIDFREYAITTASEKLNIKLDETKLKSKYLSWSENNWINGNGKKIKNWKTTLLNSLPYLKNDNNNQTDAQKRMNSTPVQKPKWTY